MNILKYIFLAFAFLMFINANAQTDAIDTSLSEILMPEEIDVVKSYTPTLAKVKKKEINPVLPERDTKPQNLKGSYINQPKFIETTFNPPQMKPLGTKKMSYPFVQNFWAKAGFGFPNNPLIDASLQTGINQSTNAGIQLKLDAATEETLRKHQHLYSRVFADFFSRINKVTVKADFEDKTHHYFGGLIGSDIPIDSIKQNSKNVGLSFAISNFKKTRNEIDYSAELNSNYLWDLESNKDRFFALNGFVKKRLDKNHIGIGLQSNFYSLDGPIFKKNLVASLNPHFFADAVGLTIGANFGIDDSTGFIFPAINFDKDINEYFGLFGGWEKQVVQNSFSSILNDNPFIITIPQLLNTQVEDRFFGVRANVNENLSFALKANQQLNSNFLLYTLGDTISNRFMAVYDSSTTIFKVTPQVDVSVNDFAIQLFGNFNDYSLSSENEAWHLPIADAGLKVNYKGIDNLNAGISFFTALGRNAKVAENSIEMSDYYDLNLNADYQLNENISIFIEGKNLLNVKYENFFLYQNYGTQARGGIIIKL